MKCLELKRENLWSSRDDFKCKLSLNWLEEKEHSPGRGWYQGWVYTCKVHENHKTVAAREVVILLGAIIGSWMTAMKQMLHYCITRINVIVCVVLLCHGTWLWRSNTTIRLKQKTALTNCSVELLEIQSVLTHREGLRIIIANYYDTAIHRNMELWSSEQNKDPPVG